MGRTLVFGAVAALSLTGAQADSRLIQTSARFQRLGDYHVTAKPTYQGAIDALGPASSCRLRLGDPTLALAVWRPLAVCGGRLTVTAPVLVAETARGRVRALVLVVGAQGD